MSLAHPLNGRQLTRLESSLSFCCFLFFIHGVTHQEIKLYLPRVIYFSFGQLNEVIVYV